MLGKSSLYAHHASGLANNPPTIPVVPHKAVAEVSKEETYRRGWLL